MLRQSGESGFAASCFNQEIEPDCFSLRNNKLRAAVMDDSRGIETMEQERALAEALAGVASDLRLVEPADFIAFTRTAQLANIGNIVSSSAELYFKPGTLRFGRLCEADLSWEGEPRISVSLEFRHKGVAACFRLILAARHAGVEIDFLSVAPPCASPSEKTVRLTGALKAARLSRGRRAQQQVEASSQG